jgi:hypothetical protein
MNTNLKVSFYLQKERKGTKSVAGKKAVYPIVGKIIGGKTMAQFGSKLKVEERLWNVKSRRAIGKSRTAVELNREINQMNLLIHSRYEEIMQEFYARVGIGRTKGSYRRYVHTYRHLQCFLKAKYNLRDIPFSLLDLPFVENFDFYLRIERGMKPASANGVIIHRLSAARVALHRDYICRLPLHFQVSAKDGRSVQCQTVGYSGPNYGEIQGVFEKWMGI